MKVIAIGGMHRSGTSFVAELIKSLGAVVGSDLLATADDNPHGFFEHRRVKELNDVVLRRLGGSWDRPPTGLSARWPDSGGLDSLRRSAEQIMAELAAEGAGAGACVIKDPRLSLTMPFWSSAVKIDHVVVPVRSPREVAQSLRHRNGFSAERSAGLWLRYTVDAVLSVERPTVVSLDDLIDDPVETVTDLAGAVGLTSDLDAALALAADRRRNWVPPRELEDLPDGELLELAESLHRILTSFDAVEPLVPVLERVAAEWRLDQSMPTWSPSTGMRTSAAEAVAERYRDLREALEGARLEAADFEEQRNVARRELRDATRRAESERQRLQAQVRELSEASERLGAEKRRLDEAVSDERAAREMAESREADAQSALDAATRRADGLEKRFRRAERDFIRLRSRRSVRIATGAASSLRPVFRTVRRLRSLVTRGTRLKPPGRRRAPRSEGVQKVLQRFPASLDAQTRAVLTAHRAASSDLAATKVSIIMPTYNRADQIGEAIASVLGQTHSAWELIVVDDGSDDDTESVVERVAGADPRVRFVKNPRGGVSRARNTGLDSATGDFVAFLDTDNTWDPEFLALITASMDQTGAAVGYSAMESVRAGTVVSYRGDKFDYDAMRSGNYIDLNVVCHRRSITDAGHRFDESLRRTVDWDYLLQICRGADVTYASFIGGRYKLHESDDQISNSEPYLYRKIVAARHDPLNPAQSAEGAYRSLELDIAIGLAAPRDRRDEWGDYHFATGLAQALERKGHRATLYYYEDQIAEHHDVTVSLRGLTGHDAPRSSVRVVWSISHPELLTWDEIEECDIFFSASLSWPQMLNWVVPKHHDSLLQATDRTRFHPHPEVRASGDVLFVGNSRNADRPMVSRAVAAGLPLSVYGTRWRGRIPDRVVKGPHIPNEKLSKAYAGAGTVLNDHWESMREFGYVSNRVFDVLASGGTLVSDPIPALRTVFGDLVAVTDDDDDLRDVVSAQARRPSTSDAQWVLDHHSFDNRAEALLARVEQFLLRPGGVDATGAGQPTAASDSSSRLGLGPRAIRGDVRTLRVAVAPQTTRNGPTSSAFIRLVQPLTSEIDGTTLDLIRVDPESDEPATDQLAGVDALIVSRTAFAEPAHAAQMMAAADSGSIPVILDVDDAFHRMDSSHPEYKLYRRRIEALDIVMRRADEIWCSTQALASSLPDGLAPVHVVPNSIDPRLWRLFRETDPHRAVERLDGLELLYSGSATHAADLELLMPALDRLARDVEFRLTVVGVAPKLAKRRWIRRMSPPHGSYPRYATWIRDNASQFDVGLAPLVDNEFNRLKSDVKVLEYLALGLVPLASATGPYLSSEDLVVGGLCATVDEWTDRLAALADGESLQHARKRSLAERERVWTERNAAVTGARLASRLIDLVDRNP